MPESSSCYLKTGKERHHRSCPLWQSVVYVETAHTAGLPAGSVSVWPVVCPGLQLLERCEHVCSLHCPWYLAWHSPCLGADAWQISGDQMGIKEQAMQGEQPRIRRVLEPCSLLGFPRALGFSWNPLECRQVTHFCQSSALRIPALLNLVFW